MGKIYKAALVLFYLLQLVIVFHEQIMHLFDSVASPIHDAASAQDPQKGFLKRLRQAMEQHQAAGVVLRSDDAHTSSIAAVVHQQDEPVHDVHHEEKSNHQKKPKRGPIRQFLISNLYPFLKRHRSPTARQGAAAGRELTRFIAFPSTAGSKA